MLGDDAIAGGAIAVEGVAFDVLVSLGEGLLVTETWGGAILPRGVIADGFAAAQGLATHLTATYSTVETIRVRDRAMLSLAVALTDGLNFSSSVVAAVAHVLANALRVRDAVAVSAAYNLTVAERVALFDLLVNLPLVVVSERLTFSQEAAWNYVASASAAEIMRLIGGFDRMAVLSLSLSDTLALADAEVLQGVYQGTIDETIETSVLYSSPDGSVTAWAINTRTGAVTQYENFAFNSFATMGRKYLAADENGLYELNGPQDLTAPVVATMAGGYFQPGGVRLAGLKGAYLGVGGQGAGGGQGTWMLKLVMGDGTQFVYQRLSNPNLMTTKFDIGKGLRARYISWELVNVDGQDFDLDSIEFVPMMSGRRV